MDGGCCHCAMCQKAYGGLYAAMVWFYRADFQFTKGEPKYYRSSEFAHRGFCNNCGSPLVFTYDEQSKLVVLTGTLDYPGDWPFDTEGWFGHAFVDDKVSWYEIRDGLPLHNRSAGYFDEAKAKHEGEGST